MKPVLLLFTLATVYGSWTTMKQCLIGKGIADSQIVAKGTNKFNEVNFQWNLRNITTPAGFLLVNKESDVQVAVNCATQTQFPIVPRGGGHSYEKYSLIDNKHLVIDLGGLNTFHMDNNVATVGAGLLLGNVYYKLWMAGKFGIPAGSCPTVGISGHILGGGYGMASRKFGLMIDQVVEMKMVDASGNLITVNQNENSDLFFALRGAGSGNYGIVTSFKIKTFDASAPVNVISITFDYSRFQEAFRSWQNWVKSIPPRSITATFYISPSYGVTLNAVVSEPDQVKARQLAQQVLAFFPKGYRQAEPVTSMSFIDMVIHFGDQQHAPNLNALGNLKRNNIARYFFKSKSNYIESYLEDGDVLAELNEAIDWAPVDGFVLLDLQGGAISDPAPDATAFVHRTKPLYSYQVINYASDEWSGNQGLTWLESVRSSFLPFTTGTSYFNYVDAELPNPLPSYYGTNLPRLVDIKLRRDPHNLFRSPMGIPTSL